MRPCVEKFRVKPGSCFEYVWILLSTEGLTKEFPKSKDTVCSRGSSATTMLAMIRVLRHDLEEFVPLDRPCRGTGLCCKITGMAKFSSCIPYLSVTALQQAIQSNLCE